MMKVVNTTRQKLKVLKGALALLGENGEHWTKNKYYGKKTRRSTLEGRPAYSRPAHPLDADSWCLVGALKASAAKAGFDSLGVSRQVSIADLVRYETSNKYDNVEDWNDARDRRWPEVKAMIEKRIGQLEELDGAPARTQKAR